MPGHQPTRKSKRKPFPLGIKPLTEDRCRLEQLTTDRAIRANRASQTSVAQRKLQQRLRERAQECINQAPGVPADATPADGIRSRVRERLAKMRLRSPV